MLFDQASASTSVTARRRQQHTMISAESNKAPKIVPLLCIWLEVSKNSNRNILRREKCNAYEGVLC